jgi:fumarate hydratase subunit alpha
MGKIMKASEVAEAIGVLETELPGDVERALRGVAEREEGLAAEILRMILANIDCARERRVPMCQDTGSLLFFVSSGQCSAEFGDAISEGVRMATASVPLRANTVNPFTRQNEGNNLGIGNPIVYFEPDSTLGKGVKLGIMAKGAGSENVGREFMLDPDLGLGGIKEAVLETVWKAGGKPCPPIVVGVGIGGTSEMAALMSKKALMRPLDRPTGDPKVDALERELLDAVNCLGIGPMGLGGKHTALGIRVEWAHCHTASLPVAVSIGCWALRRVTAEWHRGSFSIVR